LPLPGRHIGIGYPLQAVDVVTALVGVFAEVIVGATKPAKVRDRTAARTKVVFMGISWKRPSGSAKILALPDAYNLRGIWIASPLD
jgi:hypothetical protein